MEKKHECCTPKGQVPRYVDCKGCDKKPIEGATLSYAQAQKGSFNIIKKKQSSVEWLIEQVDKSLELYPCEWVETAKAMHKEEIKNAFVIRPYTNFEKYYNETFGDNNE